MNFVEIKTIAQEAIKLSATRTELWLYILNSLKVQSVLEAGVFKGVFAQDILNGTPSIKNYIFVDPWRNLACWNKPANKSDEEFDTIRSEALLRTAEHKSKIKELRMTTKEASYYIDDDCLDFAYIDGDHTLRGITIDLTLLLPKIRKGSIIGGDDFKKNIWQHGEKFDPTEVFPFALYFAEANNLKIITLPFDQFLIHKSEGFELVDFANYRDLTPTEIYSFPKSERRKLNMVGFLRRLLDVFKNY